MRQTEASSDVHRPMSPLICPDRVVTAMKAEDLAKLADASRCRVYGHEEAANGPQRAVIGALIRGFDHPDATVLCEPSLARNSTRPPDAVLVDPVAGVHVVEVKGVSLDQIEAIEPGGMFKIRYGGLVHKPKSPVAQARKAMFDIKNAAEQAYSGEITLPFKYWVVMQSISRSEWTGRWGEDAYNPPELLFADELPLLAEKLQQVGQRSLANQGLDRWPADQFACVWKAFGDSSVLYHVPEERQARRVPEATLGEIFDDAAESYKTLSEEQQKLSSQDWRGGPRLVRGVAGSGKTIVLANNLARRLCKGLGDGETLFEREERPRLLAVCYNRTLAPFIRQKIDLAFRQRTGRSLPERVVEVLHYNRLLWHLSTKGVWRYQAVESKDDQGRAGQYLAELEHVRQEQPDLVDAVVFDSIYVDEGQDFLEEDFRLLKALCRTPQDGEPDLHIFYDDAQNLLGRVRPNWKSLGLNLVGGRSHIMGQCFRNTRPLVEVAFNVLYGRFAESMEGVPNKKFGDIATLEEKGLIEDKGDRYEVRFAVRDGLPPVLTVVSDIDEERRILVERLRWLIEDQRVRPEDILVLAHSWRRVVGLAEAIRSAGIPSIVEVHVAKEDQDRILRRRGALSLSTVASAKGYDAYCVLLASANDFPIDVPGRASYYVGCTRAIEYLEVFAHRRSGLVAEMEMALARCLFVLPGPVMQGEGVGGMKAASTDDS